MNKKKLHGTLIAVIAFAILVVGATFAWLTYSFNATNGVYNTATVCFNINSSEGQDISTTLDYVTSPINGVNTSVSMGLDNACNISANGTIYLNVKDTTSSALYSQVDAHCENPDTLVTLYNYDNVTDCRSNNGAWVTEGTALKYAIYDTNSPTNNTIPITTGYISASGDNDLYKTNIKVGTIDTYYIYIWLDGELIDDRYIDALSFSGYIHTQANQKYISYQSPEIVDGLIPVKLSKTGVTVTTVAENDPTWYDYYEKEWANAVLVSEDTHPRSYYLSNPGTKIPQSDILAYYVWIPRYSYQVWAYNGSDAAGSAKEIPIKFVDTNTVEIATKNGDWYTHPAFWWDSDSDGERVGETGEELSGIWVGKFETSHISYTTSSLGCTDINCTKADGIRILPDVSPLRSNTISSFFYASRSMQRNNNPFGLQSNADSHVIKNSEWGAVAYLSRSMYGINREIDLNNDANYVTGHGYAYVNASDYYNGTNYGQSTTGNVTGIFDMRGGVNELVMGRWGTTTENFGSSGFSTMPDLKYYNLYPSTTFNGNTTTNITKCTLEYCGGHALNETKAWYSDTANFVYNNSNSWFWRGGLAGSSGPAGAFYFYYSNGGANNSTGTRLVIISR